MKILNHIVTYQIIYKYKQFQQSTDPDQFISRFITGLLQTNITVKTFGKSPERAIFTNDFLTQHPLKQPANLNRCQERQYLLIF